MILFLCAWSGVGAWGQRSAFEAQLKDFTHSLAIQLSSKTPKDSPVAIADFDDKDAAIGDADLGYAVSEIVTQEFQRSGYFLVLEKKQLDRILKTMELQLSGLYDSDKAASIGKLIDAKYLAFIGSSMSWFATTPQGLGTYSIGLALGGSYQIARSQWLSLETIFYFWHYMYSDSLQSGQIGLGGTAGSYMYDEYKLLDAFVILGEYGYRFPLSRAISLQSTLGLGAVVGGLSSYQEYATWIADATSYVPDVTTATSVWASPAAQLRLDLVFLEKNPLSFYVGTGYFLYARELEGALIVYF